MLHGHELPGDPLQQFCDDGVVLPGQVVDPGRCSRLLNDILATRSFGPDLFLSEEEFRRNPERRGVNPRPGRANVLDRFDVSSTRSFRRSTGG